MTRFILCALAHYVDCGATRPVRQLKLRRHRAVSLQAELLKDWTSLKDYDAQDRRRNAR